MAMAQGQGPLAFTERVRPKIILAGFIGDDLIDVSVMEKVGLSIGVKDAHPYITEIAHFSTAKSGGEGAFREAIEMILKAKGIYDKTIKSIRDRLESIDDR